MLSAVEAPPSAVRIFATSGQPGPAPRSARSSVSALACMPLPLRMASISASLSWPARAFGVVATAASSSGPVRPHGSRAAKSTMSLSSWQVKFESSSSMSTRWAAICAAHWW